MDDGGTNGAGDLVVVKSHVDTHTSDNLIDVTRFFVSQLERNNTMPLTWGCSCAGKNPGNPVCGRRPNTWSACPRCGADGLGAVCVDQARAYRIVDVQDDAFTRCIPARRDDGTVIAFKMKVLMFGESGAPLGYNSVARCLAMCVSRVLILPLGHYYDDFASPARLGDPDIEKDICTMFNLLGFPVSEKNQYSHVVVYLGVQKTFTTDAVSLALKVQSPQAHVHHLLRAVPELPAPSRGEQAAREAGVGRNVFIWSCGCGHDTRNSA